MRRLIQAHGPHFLRKRDAGDVLEAHRKIVGIVPEALCRFFQRDGCVVVADVFHDPSKTVFGNHCRIRNDQRIVPGTIKTRQQAYGKQTDHLFLIHRFRLHLLQQQTHEILGFRRSPGTEIEMFALRVIGMQKVIDDAAVNELGFHQLILKALFIKDNRHRAAQHCLPTLILPGQDQILPMHAEDMIIEAERCLALDGKESEPVSCAGFGSGKGNFVHG